MRLSAPFLAVLLSLSPLAWSQQPAAGTEKITADGPRATPGGVSFTAPVDWTLTKRDDMALLVSPEGDVKLAIVDVEAPDAKAAVEKAWAVYRPESKRPIRLVTPQPAREGWEERH